ncbi:hypothetical protein IMCC3317_25960 [Kordia antarctica]|uniref:Uncharacterized protein n=1 Tax=Kordia antarctica TaxID=1218801 RepID=A0A7L4ZKI2_9FLAO|nr:hypothetical protein [Kordia antarctica]QHI37218.1 hypothetical protein IMCC3317_25960 [Kordia antarctica]
MTTSYTSLFRVTVAHSYYASGNCECLHYKASSETQLLIDKYGFIMKATATGFEMYATSNQSIENYVNYISQVSGNTAFAFAGITSDQNFYNFTDVPINELGVLSFASNNTENVVTNETIQLAETFSTDTTSQEAISITIQFEDIIRFRRMNSEVLFDIQLKARETQWKYYVINNSNQEYNQLNIQSENNIQFSAPTEVTLQNGQNAVLFSSETTKIPLKNVVVYNFNLTNTKSTIAGERTETIIKGLPIPNPQNLQVNNDHTIASLVYLYI